MTATSDRLVEKISRKVEQKVRTNVQSLRGDLAAVLTKHGAYQDTMSLHRVDTLVEQMIDLVTPSIRAKTEDQIIDSLTNPPVVLTPPMPPAVAPYYGRYGEATKVRPVPEPPVSYYPQEVVQLDSPLHPAYYATPNRGPG